MPYPRHSLRLSFPLLRSLDTPETHAHLHIGAVLTEKKSKEALSLLHSPYTLQPRVHHSKKGKLAFILERARPGMLQCRLCLFHHVSREALSAG